MTDLSARNIFGDLSCEKHGAFAEKLFVVCIFAYMDCQVVTLWLFDIDMENGRFIDGL